MDPRKLEPARLKLSQIRELTENFRRNYVHDSSLPLDIEYVIEHTLGIQIIPIEDLKKDCDLEGYFSLDFKYLYIDKDSYMDDRYYKRARFTIAHEIGHFYLHRHIIDGLKFENANHWIEFRRNIPDEGMNWFELNLPEGFLCPLIHW